MAELPRPSTDKAPPLWEAWRMVLYDWILANNPAEFWQCPAVYHCMLVNHWPFQIDYEFSQLTERFHNALVIPHFGPDDPFGKVIVRHPFSMNLIHQAYHLTQWERATGKRIEQLDSIVEFGGGYGAMALLCRRMGFEGEYVIYDLPEFSLLQEYYLSQFGMLNGMEWNPKEYPKDIDLFMALYSLSEVEPEKRLDFLSQAKSYLFLYSGRWEKWDNVNYFQDTIPAIAPKSWQHTEIGHLPSHNDWYSLGW